MSPLAEEILTDLKGVFEEAGASVTMLHEWLGEDREAVKAALAELQTTDTVYFRDGRWRVRRSLKGTVRDPAVTAKVARMMASGTRPVDIGAALNLTEGELRAAIRRAKRISDAVAA